MLWCPLSPLIIAGAHAGLSCLYSLPEAEKQMWIQGQPTRLKTQQAPVQQTCTHTAESTARTFASTPSHSPAVCFQSLSHGTDIASGPELETQPHSNQSATWTWTTNTSQMTPSLHYTSNAQILTNDRGRPSLAYGILDEQIILSPPHIYIYIWFKKMRRCHLAFEARALRPNLKHGTCEQRRVVFVRTLRICFEWCVPPSALSTFQ